MFPNGISLFLSVALCIGAVSCASLPSYIHVCRRSDPNFNQCSIKAVEEIRPYLKKGIPELSVPPAEPLIVPELKIAGSGQGFTAVGKNVKIFGASEFQIHDLKAEDSDPRKPTLHLSLFLPRLKLEGDYEINAKVLVLPLKGKGPMKFEAINTKADATLYGELYKKDGKDYIRFPRMDMTLNMEDYNVQLRNLFNGDKALEEATNLALNENKHEFKEALSPTVTKTVVQFLLELANKVTKNHPYEVLFPN